MCRLQFGVGLFCFTFLFFVVSKIMLTRLFFVAFVVLLNTNIHAQSRYRFQILSTEQGLTSNAVRSICQDKFGYMWMATDNGLNRYDGHNIKQYFNNNTDSFSIPRNVVYWIHKDINGGLWFSFGDRGIARYNYARDRFEKFTPFDSLREKNNYPSQVWRMANDQQGLIYFANGSSCFRYSLFTQHIEDLTPLFNQGLIAKEIGTFIPQGNHTLWITTNNGLFRYDLQKNSIEHFSFDQEKFGFGDAEMHDAEFINDHQMLIALRRTGFVLFDVRTHSFTLPPPPIDPSESKLFSETTGVLRDAKRRIWLANSRYGMLEYFPESNTVYPLKKEYSNPYPYAEQEGSGLNVYEDDDGNIWYGTSARGVIWFNPKLDFLQIFEKDYTKAESLPHNYINYFLPLQNGEMLIGTYHGLTTFNRKTNSYQNFPVAYDDRDKFPHVNIRCMMQNGDSIFISTGYGLSLYNTRIKKFSRFIDHSLLFDSSFQYGQWLLHRIGNKVFVSGQAIAFFNLQTKRYEYSAASPKDPFNGLTSLNASMLDEASGVLWIEAGEGILYSYDLVKKSLR